MELRTLSITLSAGVAQKLPISRAEFIRIKSATSSVDVEAFHDRKKVCELTGLASGDKATAKKGEEFTAASILSAGAQTVVVQWGEGDVTSSAVAGTVTVSPSSALTSVADVALSAVAAVVSAANASRKRVIISAVAEGASALNGTIRVGDASVTATRGIELAPGQTLVLETTAAVSAIWASATAGKAAVVEET